MPDLTLVIGGAGFIGRHLVPQLTRQSADVLIADNLHPQVHDAGTPDWLTPYPFSGCDIRDSASLLAMVRWCRPTTIFALAAETGTGQSLEEPARHCATNVTGLANILECITRSGAPVRRIVLPSSRAVYGEGAWIDHDGQIFYPAPRTNDQFAHSAWAPWVQERGGAQPVPHRASAHWPRPSNVYAATKLAQEQVLSAWALGHRVSSSIVRLQNVYGPGQAVNNPYTGVLVHFARLALQGQPIPVYEDGNIVRDFIHVSDVVRALVDCTGLPAGIGPIDIGSGIGTTLYEVAVALAATAGGPAPEITGQYRLGDVRAAYADIAFAKEALSFEARVGLQDGLADLVASLDVS